MNINLFNKNIILRDTHCTKNNSCNMFKVIEPYVNLYVRLKNNCNAKCKFCEFRGNELEFDLYKFYYILSEIKKKVKINKISFTGGEPTLDVELLKNALKITNEVDKDIFKVVNTNGYNLNSLESLDINSIALSRHHYLDEINNELLEYNAPTKEGIKSFKNKDNLHLSCNLIKGYIDKESEVINYLNFAEDVGIYDVGFVSLMKVNDYCKEHHIDFGDFNFSNYDTIIKNKTWNNCDYCKCANYLHIGENTGNIVKMYSRYYMKQNNIESQLVYDINCLKNGFNGEIIMI